MPVPSENPWAPLGAETFEDLARIIQAEDEAEAGLFRSAAETARREERPVQSGIMTPLGREQYHEPGEAFEAAPWIARAPVRAYAAVERMISNYGRQGSDILGFVGDEWEAALRRKKAEIPEKLKGEDMVGPMSPTDIGVEQGPEWWQFLQGIRDTGEILFNVDTPGHASHLASKQAADTAAWHEQNQTHPAIKALDQWSLGAVDVGTSLATLMVLDKGLGGGKSSILKATGSWGAHARTFMRGFSVSEGNPLERAKGGLMMVAYSATPTAVAKGPLLKTGLGVFFKDVAMNMGISGGQYKAVMDASYLEDGTFDWEYFITNIVNVGIGDAIPSLLTPGFVRTAHARGRLGLKGGIAPRERGKGPLGAIWGQKRGSEYNLAARAGLEKGQVEGLLEKGHGRMAGRIVSRVDRGQVTEDLGAAVLKAGVESKVGQEIYKEYYAGIVPEKTAWGKLLDTVARGTGDQFKMEIEHELQRRQYAEGKEAERTHGKALEEGQRFVIGGLHDIVREDSGQKRSKLAHTPDADGTLWRHEILHAVAARSRKLLSTIARSSKLREIGKKHGLDKPEEIYANVGVARWLNKLKKMGAINGPADLIDSRLEGSEDYIRGLEALMRDVEGMKFEPELERVWRDAGIDRNKVDPEWKDTYKPIEDIKPGTAEDVSAALDDLGRQFSVRPAAGKHPWDRPFIKRGESPAWKKFQKFLRIQRQREGGGVVYQDGLSMDFIKLAKRTMDNFADQFKPEELRSLAQSLREKNKVYSARKAEKRELRIEFDNIVVPGEITSRLERATTPDQINDIIKAEETGLAKLVHKGASEYLFCEQCAHVFSETLKHKGIAHEVVQGKSDEGSTHQWIRVDGKNYDPTEQGYGDGKYKVIESARKAEAPSDREYLEAAERGDTKATQRMVDTKAIGAGYDTRKFYWGTPNTEDQLRSDRRAFVSLSDETAGHYAGRDGFLGGEGEGKVSSFYIKIKNPLKITAEDYMDRLYGKDWAERWEREEDLEELDPDVVEKINNKLEAEAKEKDHDSVYIKGSHDGTPLRDLDEDQVMVFTPGSIKSSEPITRDDSGKIIPLSQRFQPDKEDIRYSARKAVVVNRKKIERAGFTTNLAHAGFITPDGKLIDLSGKRFGRDIRSYGRMIHESLVGGYAAMVKFMAEGNIRIQGDRGAIEIYAPPTEKQYDMIRQVIRTAGVEETFVDLYDGSSIKPGEGGGPDTARKLFLAPGDLRRSESKIINQIKQFYEEGSTLGTVGPSWASSMYSSRIYRDLSKHMTPEERSHHRKDTIAKIEDLIRRAPKNAAIVAAAKLGEAGRHWYRETGQVFRYMFGDDFKRFSAVFAAMSPRQEVRDNLRTAIRAWQVWDRAGRPTSRDELLKLFRSDGDVMFGGRQANVFRALMAADQNDIRFSDDSPKVTSFYKNITGDYRAVTLDGWMEKFFGWKEQIFGNVSGYIAGSAAIRRAANELGWAPDEVQAAVWGWFKSIVEAQSGANKKFAGDLIDQIPAEVIRDAGRVNKILREDADVQGYLEKLGIELPPDPGTRGAGEAPGEIPAGDRGRYKTLLKGVTKRAEAGERERRAGQLRYILEEDPGDPLGGSKLDTADRRQLVEWSRQLGLPKSDPVYVLREKIRAKVEGREYSKADAEEALSYSARVGDKYPDRMLTDAAIDTAARSKKTVPRRVIKGFRDAAVAHIEIVSKNIASLRDFDTLPLAQQARLADQYRQRVLEPINKILGGKVEMGEGMGTWTEEGSTAANAGVVVKSLDFEYLQDFLALASRVGRQSGYYAMQPSEGALIGNAVRGLRVMLNQKMDPSKMAYVLAEISKDQDMFQGTLADRESGEIWIGMPAGSTAIEVDRTSDHLRYKLAALLDSPAEIIRTQFKVGENYGDRSYDKRLNARGLQKARKEVSRNVYPEIRKIRAEAQRAIKSATKAEKSYLEWASDYAQQLIAAPSREAIMKMLEQVFGTNKENERYDLGEDFPDLETESRWWAANEFQADIEHAAVERDYQETSELLADARQRMAEHWKPQYLARIAQGPGYAIDEGRSSALRDSLYYITKELYEKYPELKKMQPGVSAAIKSIRMGESAVAKILKGDWPAVGEAARVAEGAAAREREKAEKAGGQLEAREARLRERLREVSAQKTIERIEAQEKLSDVRRKLRMEKAEALRKQRDLQRISREIQSARRKLNKQIHDDLRVIRKLTSTKTNKAPEIADAVAKIFGAYTWKDLSKQGLERWQANRDAAMASLQKAVSEGKLVGLDVEQLLTALKSPPNKLTVAQLSEFGAMARQLRDLNVGVKGERWEARQKGFWEDRKRLIGLEPGVRLPRGPYEGRGTPEGFWDKTKRVFRTWDRWMYRPDRLYEIFGGDFRELVFNRIDRSHDRWMAATSAFRDRMDNMVSEVLGSGDIEAGWKRWSEMDNTRVRVGEVELYETEILQAYMYSQNQGAYKKLIENNEWSPETVDAIRGYAEARPEMTELAERIFDMHAKQYPALRDLIFKLTGKTMGWQKAYLPLLTVRDIMAKTESDTILDMLGAYDIQPGVDKSFAKGRRGHTKQIELDLTRNLFHSMETVERFLHMGEALDRANRLMNDPDVASHLDKNFGPEAYQVGRKWIQDLMRPRTMRHDIEPVLRFYRTRAITAVLGLNLVTTLKQGVSTMAAMSFVRPDYMLRGWAEVIKNPIENRRLVGSMDEKVKQRFARGAVERDILELRKSTTGEGVAALRGKAARGWKGLPEKALYTIKAVDRLTVEAVWRAAYEQKLAETNGDDHGAQDFARMVVRRTQPMGGEIDLPHIYRGGEVAKLFTAFQNQVNQNWMLLRHDAYRDFLAGDYKEATAKVMFAYILPALMMGVITRGGLPLVMGEDEKRKFKAKDVAADLINYPTAGWFLANNIVRGISGYLTDQSIFDYQPMAVKGLMQPVEIFKVLSEKRTSPEGIRKQRVRAAGEVLKTVGTLTGLPAQAPLRTVKGAVRLAKGEATYGVKELVWSPWTIAAGQPPAKSKERNQLAKAEDYMSHVAQNRAPRQNFYSAKLASDQASKVKTNAEKELKSLKAVDNPDPTIEARITEQETLIQAAEAILRRAKEVMMSSGYRPPSAPVASGAGGDLFSQAARAASKNPWR